MAIAETVCVVGAKGMLGHELSKVLAVSGEAAPSRLYELDLDEIDIADEASVNSVLGRLQPRLLINAAAYTDVDGCESHEEVAEAVNGAGPGHLAGACASIGCRLVHVSTDFVFDGKKPTPYVVGDPVDPVSAYGRTKAIGERNVREGLDDHVIVRTSWLFGVHGANFVKTIRRLAGERDELRVVDDQCGSPTYAADLATALVALGTGGWKGTYHFCNAGVCSWHGFATEIVRLSGGIAKVLPMNSDELDRPAVRPANSALCTEKLVKDTGIIPRPWQDALAECVSALS